ncbi:MAG: hypothetical protein JWN49_658 [Parcubacteria group bacterium]|nr:hypothetical protein [Parcubacteria group bacterium]
MNKEIVRQTLLKEGFNHVYEWHDEADFEHSTHTHKGEVSIYITQGELNIWFDDGEITLMPGDQFDVPVGKEHRAKAGKNGCDYLVGEMIEGDS